MKTHNIPFLIESSKKSLNYPKSAAMGFCSKGLKREFETVVVNRPSAFEPLKLYGILPQFNVCSFHHLYYRNKTNI